jgi:hypothetical protein
MVYITATGHSVPLMIQIAEGGHALVYASVLHALFGFNESGNFDRNILQFSFHDDKGQLWLLSPGRYRAFELNPDLMVASTDLVLQPLDMSSVQPPCCIL